MFIREIIENISDGSLTAQQMLNKLSKEMQGTHTGAMDPNSDWSKFVLSHKGFTLKDIQVDQIPTAVKSDGMSQDNIEKYKKADTSQFPPMVIGNNGYLLDGNHRLQAYKAQGIKTVKAYVGEEVEVSLHGDAKKGYVLSKIEVSGDERNAGQGTKAMQDIVDRMDREGAIIALTPDDAFGGNKNRLIKFYKRFGFVPNKGRNKDFRFRETMIRYPQSNVEENFKDGKVKGKSRPGRVKRSGASCNGSVTELRAKAKKASGEKAKMYHWCANMKAGKKK